MRKLGRGVAHGGTYTAHSVALAAAEKTLEILEETDALERIADYGTRLREGMHAVLQSRGVPHSFVGHPSMSGLYFAARAAAQLPRLEAQRLLVLRRHGAACCTTSASSASRTRASRGSCRAAHDDSCLADTMQASKSRSTDPAHGRCRAPAAGLSRDQVRRDRRRRGPQRAGRGVLPGARGPARCRCSNATTTSAARPSAASCTATSPIPTAPTSAACCGRRSCARSNCRSTGCRSFPTTAAAR